MSPHFLHLTRRHSLLLAVGLLTLGGCSLTGLDDGLALVLDTNFVEPVVTLQIADAETGELLSASVRATGDGAEHLVTSDGKKNFSNVHGLITLAIRKSHVVSESSPLVFTLTAEAPGYLRSSRTFALIDTTGAERYDTFRMMPLSSPPAGITVRQAAIGSGSGGTTSETLVVADDVQVTIPSGVQMTNDSGGQVTGDLELTMVSVDPASASSARVLPPLTLAAFDEAGQDLGVVSLQALGAFSLEITGSSEVRRFSDPINVRVDFPAGTVDSNSGRLLAAGDQLPVWSHDETAGGWRRETTLTVQQDGSGLFGEYAQEHLSTWVVGPYSSACFYFQATVESPIPSFSTVQRFYLAELRSADTDKLLSTNFLQFKDSEIVTFFFVPDETAVVQAYSGNEVCKGELLAQSDPVNLCGFTGRIDFTDDPLFAVEDVLEARIETSGICTDTDPTLVVAPTLTILYRERGVDCDDNSWAPLGVMSGGLMSTTGLQRGRSYDFKIAQGGLDFEFGPIDLRDDEDSYAITIESGDAFDNWSVDVQFDFTSGASGVGSELSIIMHDIDLGDRMCETWRCHQDGGGTECSSL